MSLPLAILAQFLHLLLVLAAALLLPGLLDWARARFQGRHGPHPLQPALDWLALLRKQPVAAESASAISSIAPYAGFAATLAALLLAPGFAHGMALSPLTDLVLLAGLLAVARAARALAAMDAGTATGGLSAAGGMGLAALTLPTLLLAAMGFAILTGTTSADGIALSLREASPAFRVPLGLMGLALLAVALAETGRLPAGDPAGEAIGDGGDDAVPEASGRHLALWRMQSALRLVFWLSLLVALFVPFGMAGAASGFGGWALALLLWPLKLLVLTLALAVAEARLARLRAARLAELLTAALLLALLGVVWLFLSAGVA
jgi:formate hydrogenlyase subunit 4